nr:glycosyltransferase [Halothiobacillus sp.]
ADAIVCVSRGVEEEVIAMCPSAAARTRTIYNPVLRGDQIRPLMSRMPRLHGAMRRIIALGRLTPQKGFDILIQAVALLPSDPSWCLDIYGSGPMRAELEAMIERLHLTERVTLHGYTKCPLNVLSNADIFALSSRYEGFGLVLIEAMSLGLQIVASDCPHGPREILEDGKLGLLVQPEDIEGLAEALSQTLSGAFVAATTELQTKARQFTTETAYRHWYLLLQSTSS